jgi:hypothetical protein|tara:strand:- start:250 stop:744 length:495 start_codon:yes stop_codon:yes gene_type:complete
MYTTEIIKDKFWILEDAGVKLGTIRKKDDSNFEVIIRNEGIDILDTDALTTKYGSSILEPKLVNKIESVEYGKALDEVNGYPCKHKPCNVAMTPVKERDIPTYTKTETSKTLYAAGYYGLHFNGVWRNTYCVKLETLHNYEFVGPFKTKTELEAEVLKASKMNV